MVRRISTARQTNNFWFLYFSHLVVSSKANIGVRSKISTPTGPGARDPYIIIYKYYVIVYVRVNKPSARCEKRKYRT